MSDTTYAWAPITKTVKEDDGTLLVYGPAASSALDRDQQRLDGAWLDAAMPRWMAEGGGVREQHDSKRAVGVGVGLSKGDDGSHMLTARIVDPVAVKKIEHGVLRGFSVGIKNPRVQMGKADAPNGLVVAGDVIEVSVVDRPANPECRFDMAKADAAGDLQLVEDAQVVEKGDATPAAEPQITMQGSVLSDADLRAAIDRQLLSLGMTKADLSAAGRRKAAAAGAAMEDGSYPISTKADLRKAIKAVGRGNADHDAIRKHIIKRAKALGLEGLVPSNWKPDGSIADAAKADQIEKAEEALRLVRALLPDLAKADDGDGDESADIASAGDAIAVIARLIISEAESLAQGNLNEACDIALLLEAIRSLRWFKEREANEDEGADMALSDDPDLTKGETPAPSAEAAEVKPDTSELLTKADADAAIKAAVAEALAAVQTSPADTPETVTKADLADLVKAAVAEAKAAEGERIDALAADLAKAHSELDAIKAQPIPGGPVITRSTMQQAEARNSDADRLRAEARHYQAKADLVEDRSLRDGYLERSRELLAKADA